MHGCAAEAAANFTLSAGEQRHDQQRGASQNDSSEAGLRNGAQPEIAKRLESDVGGEGEEAGSDDAEGDAFVAFAVMDVSVGRHPPEECGAGNHFDEAVEAEADERDAASDQSGYQRDKALEAVPGEGEVFETAASADQESAVGDGGVGHAAYVNRRAGLGLTPSRKSVAG